MSQQGDPYSWAVELAQRIDPEGEWVLRSTQGDDWVFLFSRKHVVTVTVHDKFLHIGLDEAALEERLRGWLGRISLRAENL